MSIVGHSYTQNDLFPSTSKIRKTGRPKKYLTEEERVQALREAQQRFHEKHNASIHNKEIEKLTKELELCRATLQAVVTENDRLKEELEAQLKAI